MADTAIFAARIRSLEAELAEARAQIAAKDDLMRATADTLEKSYHEFRVQNDREWQIKMDEALAEARAQIAALKGELDALRREG